MATALLITTTDLKKFSVLNGNVDNDKFIMYIEIAQDIHIKQYLGTDLLEKLQSLLPTDIELVGNVLYKTLLEIYVKPMLIHWAQVELMPFMAYTISNGGVFKHSAENSQSVDKNEIDFLIEKERSIAQNYTRRFVDYMCENSELYPEYLSNSGADVNPDKTSDFGGWVL